MPSRKITQTEGAGAGATERFIREEILTRFGNPYLDPLEDGSWVNIGHSQVIVTSDSYVIDPPIFPGGDIGRLCVAGGINDLVASGAIPRYLALSLIIAEGFPYESLHLILDSAARTSREADVQVVAGDTKIVGGQLGSIFINVTSLGVPLRLDRGYSVSDALMGDKIIITGTMGDHGFSILSFREGLGFEQRVCSDCAPLHDLILPILKDFDQVRCLRDPTRGGLENVLLDIVRNSRCDALVRRESIPVIPEVEYGCEMLGLNPLQLVNEGKMVLVVGAAEADAVLDRLKTHPLGHNAAIIGEIQPSTGTHGKLFIENNGSINLVARSEGLPIPRLC